MVLAAILIWSLFVLLVDPLSYSTRVEWWSIGWYPGISLCMLPANERWCYNVMLPLIGWAHSKNGPWISDDGLEQRLLLVPGWRYISFTMNCTWFSNMDVWSFIYMISSGAVDVLALNSVRTSADSVLTTKLYTVCGLGPLNLPHRNIILKLVLKCYLVTWVNELN